MATKAQKIVARAREKNKPKSGGWVQDLLDRAVADEEARIARLGAGQARIDKAKERLKARQKEAEERAKKAMEAIKRGMRGF